MTMASMMTRGHESTMALNYTLLVLVVVQLVVIGIIKTLKDIEICPN